MNSKSINIIFVSIDLLLVHGTERKMNNTIPSGTIGVGVDIESLERFKCLSREKDISYLAKIFTETELDYCFSKEEAYPHLAARFVGKEAVIKALYSIGIRDLIYSDIEITNDNYGVPMVRYICNTMRNITTKISLSHSAENAIAFVIIREDDTDE